MSSQKKNFGGPKSGGGKGSPKTQLPPKKIERGVVASVPSGDRIVVFLTEATTKSAIWQPPKRRDLRISRVNAPKPSQLWYDENEEEHYTPPGEFFWDSREFLRKLAIGKNVEFTVVSKPPDASSKDSNNTNTRELAVVTLGGKDLGREIVTAGWGSVKQPENTENIPAYLKDLLTLQNDAKTAGIGLHAPKSDKAKPDAHLEEPTYDFDHFAKYLAWKDKPLKGIVEAVLTGSMLRVVVFPELNSIVLRIAGVRAPAYRKDGTHTEAYGREAQFTAERYTLNRDVDILLTGFDKDKKEEGSDEDPFTGTFYGEISIKGASVGELLLEHGLAALVEWSTPSGKLEKYQKLEQAAHGAGLRIWAAKSGGQEKAPRQVPSSSSKSTFTGIVKGVISGNTLTVENIDVNPPRLETITLSSVNVPKFGRNDNPDEPMAFEAREFVRQKLIGNKVKVIVDYSRPATESSKDSKGLPAKSFHTVEFEGVNLALALVENSLATVLENRGDRRSANYDSLMLAQDRASKKGVGLHSKSPSRHYINDISRDAKKAKTLFQSLSIKPRHEGVVEYVISGSKLKINLLKQNLLITLTLSGVRTPNKGPTKPGEEPKAPPPFATEAVDFTRNFCHHFDVEVEIDGQDKTGQFKGYIFKGKRQLNQLLLEEGLGEYVPCKKYEESLLAAEQRAKNAQRRLWENYDAAKEEENRKAREEARAEQNKPIKLMLRVTEVIDATQFYAQAEGEDKQKLDQLMGDIAAQDWLSKDPYLPERGEVVLAQFSGDDVWYRAKVLFANDKQGVKVFYGDYGNSEMTEAKHIRELPSEFSLKELPFQAYECSLAYINPQKVNGDFGPKAALVLKNLVWEKLLIGCVEYKKNNVMYVTLWDETKTCINGELVRKGLAKLDQYPSRSAAPELIAFLREQQDIAHDKHKGMWMYGDPGGSDEEL